ncbi:MAG: MBL fold metallo-hydrolase [archaeon]
MISKVNDEVLKFEFEEFGSNCYLINKKILIDAGSKENIKEFKEDFKKNNLKFEDVKEILLTHLHWDHIGCAHLFSNAKVYCSAKEIEDWNERKNVFLRHPEEVPEFELLDIKNFKNKDFKILEVPGHTAGSLAFLYKKILFSGDTIFDTSGTIGRTDFPNAIPEKMQESIQKLLDSGFKILCAGH